MTRDEVYILSGASRSAVAQYRHLSSPVKNPSEIRVIGSAEIWRVVVCSLLAVRSLPAKVGRRRRGFSGYLVDCGQRRTELVQAKAATAVAEQRATGLTACQSRLASSTIAICFLRVEPGSRLTRTAPAGDG